MKRGLNLSKFGIGRVEPIQGNSAAIVPLIIKRLRDIEAAVTPRGNTGSAMGEMAAGRDRNSDRCVWPIRMLPFLWVRQLQIYCLDYNTSKMEFQ